MHIYCQFLSSDFAWICKSKYPFYVNKAVKKSSNCKLNFYSKNQKPNGNVSSHVSPTRISKVQIDVFALHIHSDFRFQLKSMFPSKSLIKGNVCWKVTHSTPPLPLFSPSPLCRHGFKSFIFFQQCGSTVKFPSPTFIHRKVSEWH